MNSRGPDSDSSGVSRRRFLGYLIAGPTLVAAAPLLTPSKVFAADASPIPTAQLVDHYDLTDFITDAMRPTAHLITVEVNPDGTVSFDLHRTEVGQGITTAVAMTIADEMGIPLDKVHITLSDARPELVFNHFTGGSSSMHTIFTPVRVAAALARGSLLAAAAGLWNQKPGSLSIADGFVTGRRGRRASFGELTRRAAVSRTKQVEVFLKPPSQFTIIGKPTPRIEAKEIVTGKKVFAMDLDVPGALPTMLARAPTINGSARSVRNLAAVKAMPGVTDVALIPHTPTVPGGVAVRAATFGQCIDAVRALDVEWGPGTVDGKSDADVLADLKAAEVPLTPALPGDVHRGYVHLPFPSRRPARDQLRDRRRAQRRDRVLGVHEDPDLGQGADRPREPRPPARQREGARRAGRRLVRASPLRRRRLRGRCRIEGDGQAGEADVAPHRQLPSGPRSPDGDLARTDRALGRQGARPRSATHERRHGFLDGLRRDAQLEHGDAAQGNRLTYAQAIFSLTANVPYNFGAVTQLLDEIYDITTFNTSSVRNIYSPDVCTAIELMVDRARAARWARIRTSSAVRSCATTDCSRCSTRSPRRATGAVRWRRARRRGSRCGASTRVRPRPS